MLKCLVLLNGTILIGKIEEVSAELGDPNCQISDFYEITSDGMKKWFDFSDENKVMLRSENILTIVEPNLKTVKEYESIEH
jgi:small nuclear ribonucleoprotein (snRNP)-like protein